MAFGDFTVTRASTKNVLGSAGLYVSVANNVPAIEFNTNRSYRGMSIEPSATNLMVRSQELDNASWSKLSGGTGSVPVVTANNAISPDGTMNADLVFFDRGAGNTSSDFSRLVQTATVANATVYTGSIFLKAGTPGDVGKQLAFRHVAGGTYLVVTLTADWVQYSRTETSISTSGNFIIDNRGTNTADNTVSAHIWQAQLELGVVATSYIVTAGVAVERSADVVTKTSASAFIGQPAGTVFLEYESRDTSSTSWPIAINSSATNRILFIRNSNKTISAYVETGEVVQATITTSGTPSGIQRIAIAYNTNDVAFYNAGVSVGTDTSVAIPSMNTILLGGSSFNGWIRTAYLGEARLPNATLALLTA